MKRKILNISGGATKIAGLAGATDYIINEYGYKPTDITGVSSGAILTLPIALGKWDEIRNLTTSFSLDDIFDKKPVNKKNRITLNSVLRVLSGKTSLGTQNNLKKTISKIVTPLDFFHYQNDEKYPDCYVGSVDFKTGSRKVFNLKNKTITYDDYLELVNSSASIPLAVEPVYFNDYTLYDGGVRNHILSTWSLENIENIESTISVFSRPKEIKEILGTKWDPKNILDVFNRYISITNIEISKSDEENEKLLVKLLSKKDNKISLKQVFTPYVIKELYDTDPIKLKELYDLSYKMSKDYLL
jgi:predicted patatin/cPLA2 family phospholipase